MGKYKNVVYDYAETWSICNEAHKNKEDVTASDIHEFFCDDNVFGKISEKESLILCDDIISMIHDKQKLRYSE